MCVSFLLTIFTTWTLAIPSASRSSPSKRASSVCNCASGSDNHARSFFPLIPLCFAFLSYPVHSSLSYRPINMTNSDTHTHTLSLSISLSFSLSISLSLHINVTSFIAIFVSIVAILRCCSSHSFPRSPLSLSSTLKAALACASCVCKRSFDLVYFTYTEEGP